MASAEASVVAVSRGGKHRFSKDVVAEITLVAGLGVAGDAHAGATVQHRSRVAADPTQPNLRQVHLIQSELFTEVAGHGYDVEPGQLGENVTTAGIDLLALPRGTHLHLGETAVVEVTGLRNSCAQINTFTPGLLTAVLGRDERGHVIRKAGIMAIVLTGGPVTASDTISVRLPAEPHQALERV